MAIGFLRYSGTDPCPPEKRVQLFYRGRFVQPSVEYVDGMKKRYQDIPLTKFSGSAHISGLFGRALGVFSYGAIQWSAI